MNRLRFWFGNFRLLLSGKYAENISSHLLELIYEQGKQISSLNETMADLIAEVNALRNAQPIQQPETTGQRIRRIGSWRATVAAIQARPLPGSPQPITHERTA